MKQLDSDNKTLSEIYGEYLEVKTPQILIFSHQFMLIEKKNKKKSQKISGHEFLSSTLYGKKMG